jgi:hypothetical protein
MVSHEGDAAIFEKKIKRERLISAGVIVSLLGALLLINAGATTAVVPVLGEGLDEVDLKNLDEYDYTAFEDPDDKVVVVLWDNMTKAEKRRVDIAENKEEYSEEITEMLIERADNADEQEEAPIFCNIHASPDKPVIIAYDIYGTLLGHNCVESDGAGYEDCIRGLGLMRDVRIITRDTHVLRLNTPKPEGTTVNAIQLKQLDWESEAIYDSAIVKRGWVLQKYTDCTETYESGN